MIGPILVEVDSPVFTDHIAVSVKEHVGTKYLVGQWDKSGFSATDLIYRYSYAVGRLLLRITHLISPGICVKLIVAVHIC